MSILDNLEGANITFNPDNCNHAVSFVRDGQVITYRATAIECPHCLRHRIAELERQNELLLDLVEGVRNGDPSIEAMPAYRAAVDGGALQD